jgi:hypothetical protein
MPAALVALPGKLINTVMVSRRVCRVDRVALAGSGFLVPAILRTSVRCLGIAGSTRPVPRT